jgi:hypothetical protein
MIIIENVRNGYLIQKSLINVNFMNQMMHHKSDRSYKKGFQIKTLVNIKQKKEIFQKWYRSILLKFSVYLLLHLP